ncbi:hypothetical protein GN956_G7811 [Arapaima gigas]
MSQQQLLPRLSILTVPESSAASLSVIHGTSEVVHRKEMLMEDLIGRRNWQQAADAQQPPRPSTHVLDHGFHGGSAERRPHTASICLQTSYCGLWTMHIQTGRCLLSPP